MDNSSFDVSLYLVYDDESSLYQTVMPGNEMQLMEK